MRITTVLRALLGLKHARVTGFRFTETELVVGVAPAKRSSFCSTCGKRGRRYDRRKRRWRHLDTCGLAVELEYAIWRVDCRACGVTTEMVPWAAAGSGFTAVFEDAVAALAQRTDKTTVTRMMRVSWATVGRIIERVVDDEKIGTTAANVATDAERPDTTAGLDVPAGCRGGVARKSNTLERPL